MYLYVYAHIDGRVCTGGLNVSTRKPRPSWSAIGCVRAIRSDGRLSLFYLHFPFCFNTLSLSFFFLLLLLSCFFSLLHTEREENPLGIASSSSVGTWEREPLKKRNKSTWDINQVRQPCRGQAIALVCVCGYISASAHLHFFLEVGKKNQV